MNKTEGIRFAYADYAHRFGKASSTMHSRSELKMHALTIVVLNRRDTF